MAKRKTAKISRFSAKTDCRRIQYMRFIAHLEETRRLINEENSALCEEAMQLLPQERLAMENQLGNACGLIVRWLMDEVTSPLPYDDNRSPLKLLMLLDR